MGTCSVICYAREDAIKGQKYGDEIEEACREIEKKDKFFSLDYY
jgi:hypothetical protein